MCDYIYPSQSINICVEMMRCDTNLCAKKNTNNTQYTVSNPVQPFYIIAYICDSFDN